MEEINKNKGLEKEEKEYYFVPLELVLGKIEVLKAELMREAIVLKEKGD